MRQIEARGKGMWARVMEAVGRAGRARKVAVGLSGGADSVVLAEAVWRSGAKPILFHFNHRWRGPVGDADAKWVEAWGKKRGLRVVVGPGAESGTDGGGGGTGVAVEFFSPGGEEVRGQGALVSPAGG